MSVQTASCSLRSPSSEEESCSEPPCCEVWTRATASGCVPLAWSEPTQVIFGNVISIDSSIDAAGRLVVVAEVVEQVGSSVATAAVVDGGAVVVEPLSDGLPGRAFGPRLDSARQRPIDAVVWRQSAEQGSAVFLAQRRGEGGWDKPVAWDERLSVGDDAYEPDVAIGAGEQLLVAYNQWLDEHYRIAVASDDADGVVVNPAEPYVSPEVNFSNNPRLATGADGVALVSWYQATEQGDLMAFGSERSDVASGFTVQSSADHLSGQFGPVEGSWPAVSAAGTRAVVWRQEIAPGTFSVFAATRLAAQAWQRPQSRADAVSRGHGFIDYVRAGFDADEQLVVVWQVLEGEGRSAIWYAAAAAPYSDWQVQRLSSAYGVAIRPELMVDVTSQRVAVGWIDAATMPQRAQVVRRLSPLQHEFSAPDTMPGGLSQSLIRLVRGEGQDALVSAWVTPEGVSAAYLR